MADLHLQLAELRRRVARIDRKFTRPLVRPPHTASLGERCQPERYAIEEWMSGQEVETPCGSHFETERLWERHRRHGSLDVSSLHELPHDLLGAISDGAVRPCPVDQWAFLDTETTGLAGGSGTYAFLVGVGRITAEGFRLRQFFMRDFGEEHSMLHALAAHLQGFRVLVTFNGKTYDQPLLETRFRLARARLPFERMEHLDLLRGARRLWKLRYESCRLVDLESQVLGVERQGDLPGEMIPYVYFEYVRSREAFRLAPIFHHNAYDILTLAALTGIVPWAFHSPEPGRLGHGAKRVGLARWLLQSGRQEQARELFRGAIEQGLADELLFRTLWDLALVEKRLGGEAEALALWGDLSVSRNPYRAAALEELAKHHEHKLHDYDAALRCTREALELEESDSLLRRRARLERLLAPPKRKVGKRRPPAAR